jgi:exopolysaccharide biosynthesis polyprenyl glycosylphosphotransferase
MSDVLATRAERVRASAVLEVPWSFGRRRFWRDSLRRRLLALADVVSVVAAALALWAWGAPASEAVVTVAFVPGWLVVAKICGLYDRDHRSLRYLTVDELSRIAGLALGGTAALTAVLLAFGREELLAEDRLKLWVLIAGAAFAARVAARAAWRRLVPPERALILGHGSLAQATRRKLELFPDIHVEVVGEHAHWKPDELRSDGRLLDDVDRVIVASSAIDEAFLAELLAVARQRQLKLSVVPPMRGMLGTAVQLSHVADLPLVDYHTWDTARTTLLGKRVLDIVVSAAALVVLSPLMLAVALAIRLTSPGPVLFVQRRAGLLGRPFRMLKFRTMVGDAEERLAELVDLSALHEPSFKLRDDPRVTRVGRILRRTSLDELPQLVNVLRGEMSLVGPRPEQVELVERYSPEQRFRLTVKPGLTGPMQVYGRGALGFEERLAVERDYIENVSLGRDLRILALTIAPVLRRRGAY